MKPSVCQLFLLAALLCAAWQSPAWGQPARLDDPEGLLAPKEKEAIERAIGYESGFYNRLFADKSVGLSDLQLTLIEGYAPYALYLSQFMEGGSVGLSAGFYSHEARELVVCVDKKYKKSFLATVFHELSHAFLHLHTEGKTVPPWLDEGLATYFAGMTYSPHKATHRTNTYLTARVRTLIQLGEIDLADFVHWDYGRFAAESFAQEGYGYAVGYCMVLFLMRQLGEERMFDLFRQLPGASSGIPAFERYYPGGFERFERDFTDYFQ